MRRTISTFSSDIARSIASGPERRRRLANSGRRPLIEPLSGDRVVLPLADTIYWINYGGDSIRGAALNGGGTVDTLYDSGDGVSQGYGVALDPVAGRIYWVSYAGSTVCGAPLAGGGTVDTLYDSG